MAAAPTICVAVVGPDASANAAAEVSMSRTKLRRRARLPFHRTVWLLARRQVRQSRSTLLKVAPRVFRPLPVLAER